MKQLSRDEPGYRAGLAWISKWKSRFTAKTLTAHGYFYLILAIYIFPVFFVLTTYPFFYDDESWLYLSPIEALRGNGFTWAAFGEGQSANFTFDIIVYPLLRLSPFSLEPTIRLISIGAGALTLVAAYLAARRLVPRAALIAPSLLVLNGSFYWLSRYGRSDSLSLLLLTGSIWLSLAERPMLAGIGAGLSTTLYPLNSWVALVDGLIVYQRRRWIGLVSFGGGIATGVSWHLYEIAEHLKDFLAITKKFSVSVSLHSKSSFLTAISRSIINERSRYFSYVDGLVHRGDYASLCSALVFIGCFALSLKTAGRWIAILLVALPLAIMATLVGLKNPYEFIFCLPALAIASAIGADRLPRPIVRVVIVCTLGLIVFVHWRPAIQQLGAPTPKALLAAAARALPEGAIVFSPVLFAPIMEERPDIRFFTYHAFSPGDDWRLPECGAVPQLIRDVVRSDSRPTSQRYKAKESPNLTIHFIWIDWYRLGYLRLIWPGLTEQQADCLMPMNRIDARSVTVRGIRSNQDQRIVIGRLDLDRTRDRLRSPTE